MQNNTDIQISELAPSGMHYILWWDSSLDIETVFKTSDAP